MQSLQNSLSFFSLMRRAVTVLQLTRMHNTSVVDVQKWLDQMVREKKVMEEGGEYWLAESENKKSCVAREDVKKRFEFAVQLAKYNPFIKGIALANSWTFDASKKSSDVDVVMVCQKNRLYIARLLFVLPLKVLQLRPNETELTPICASYFIDETEQLATAMLGHTDVYYAYWVSNLYCVGDEKSWKEVLTDIKKRLASWELQTPVVERGWEYNWYHKIIQKITRMWADYGVVEALVKKVQQWYLPESQCVTNTGVAITSKVFKAHTDDKREELIKKFEELCQKHNNVSSPTAQQ